MATLDQTTLILQVRKELIETGTSSGQWDDTEIKQFLQEANERLTDISQLEGNVTAQTTAGQEWVGYPATLTKVLGIWSRKNGTNDNWVKLRVATKDERFPEASSADRGSPRSYFIFGGKIYLLPIPDVVYDLNIFGYLAASDLAAGGGSTTPIFDAEFHYLCRVYAVARGKQKVDDPGYANYDAQYGAGIIALQVKLEFERNAEGPRMPKLISGMWD